MLSRLFYFYVLDEAGDLSSTVDGFGHLKVVEQEVEVILCSHNKDSAFFQKSPNKSVKMNLKCVKDFYNNFTSLLLILMSEI